MKRPSIQLLNTDRSHNRYITPHERDRMVDKGDARKAKPLKKRSTVETYQLIPPPPILRSIDEASAPSITRSDMEINAGIGARSDIARVKAKVAEFSDGREERAIEKLAKSSFDHYNHEVGNRYPDWDRLDEDTRNAWRKRAARARGKKPRGLFSFFGR